MFGLNFPFSPFTPPETHFERNYACYPVSFAGRDTLEKGNKILLPQSALSTLAQMNVSWPMLFRISNCGLHRETHGGVLEFSAEEGACYMPYWMMKNLLIGEGEIVKVVNTSLPKGDYVKLQPLTADFLSISDHRAVLEHALRYFAALTVGDCIVIQHNNKNYEIEILECRPGRAISIIETDVQVDFALPKDYVEPDVALPSPATPTSTMSSGLPLSRHGSETPGVGGISGKIQEEAKVQECKDSTFSLFSGSGSRLDGRPISQQGSLVRKNSDNNQQQQSSFSSSSSTVGKLRSPSISGVGDEYLDEDVDAASIAIRTRLPGGVRTFCAEHTQLIREGKIPGIAGNTKRADAAALLLSRNAAPASPSSFPSSSSSSSSSASSSSSSFQLFGGKGKTS